MTRLAEHYYRIISNRPLSKFLLPCPGRFSESTGSLALPLKLEIVSHCWNYSHLLAYQLSSLVLYPPSDAHVTMTVCYSEEDHETVKLLRFFESHSVSTVHWQWCPLTKQQLFRRAIGRNIAALQTQADWIWFTDCDQVFHRGCLDALAHVLATHPGRLVFPRVVACTELLEPDDPLFRSSPGWPKLVEIDPQDFHPSVHYKAIGALQILKGEVAKRLGYCNTIEYFQKPVQRWQKTYEDRTFRCLVGSQGEAIDVPALYRIEHRVKGRKSISSHAA